MHGDPVRAADRHARQGTIWVCGACGKTSRDCYGGETATPGWDESCALNAVLCDEASVKRGADGRAVSADPAIIGEASHG